MVDKLLPSPTDDNTSYPDAYLAVWVEVLEVAMYCCGVTTTQTDSVSGGGPTNVQIKQIYPSRKLLEWVTRVLTMDSLKHHIYQCCSVELRAKVRGRMLVVIQAAALTALRFHILVRPCARKVAVGD